MNQYFDRVPYVPRQCHTVTKLEQAHGLRVRVRVHVFFEANLEHGSILSNSVFFKISSLIIILAMLYLSYLY